MKRTATARVIRIVAGAVVLKYPCHGSARAMIDASPLRVRAYDCANPRRLYPGVQKLLPCQTELGVDMHIAAGATRGLRLLFTSLNCLTFADAGMQAMRILDGLVNTRHIGE